jgi:Protein of unknown function (DUF3489)
MSIKLTDTQLVILSAAAQRDDRCLTMPKSLKGSAAQKVSSKLLAAGLVREIRAKPGAPVWRRDEETETSYSLKLTTAGLKAISVDEDDVQPTTSSASTSSAARANPNSAATEIDGLPVPVRSVGSATAPREGTKMAGVVALLERDRGATLAELIAATDWLPHTVRAALTGLRKRGFVITLDRSSNERGSTYAIPRDQGVAAEARVTETVEPPPVPADRAKKPSRRAKSERAALTAIGSAA